MNFLKKHLFSILSWIVTLFLIGGIVFAAYTKKDAFVASAPPIIVEVTVTPESNNSGTTQVSEVDNSLGNDKTNPNAIKRKITLKTLVPTDRPVYETIHYIVARGDSTFSIATENNIEPETLLWANHDTLQDSPDSLRVGQELNIPPVDGIYYEWKENDTIENIAYEFEADPNDILNFPGNDIDLTNPTFEAGNYVMVPGGSREFVQWVVPIASSGDSGTAGGTGSSCPPGAFGTGYFVWPADNHFLSGNDYWSGHLAIDIAANTGAAIYAADSGVVTMAQGGYNYGYGNVIAIDHGNGFATLYAHLSQINVGPCSSVYAGQMIGLSGNTGNSFGAHLHFEIRHNGAFENPWRWLP